jgi:type VI secretion system secreted protein Hcp
MKGEQVKRKIAIAAALVAVIAAGAGTYAYAASQGSTTINGCVAKDGKLRVLAANEACKNDETALSWNTTGPTGADGPAGAVGPAGPAGRDGRDGQPGSAAASPDAIDGTITINGAKHGPFSQSPMVLIGLSHEIVSPRDPASGLPTGKRQHKPIVITKQMDSATPLFLDALLTNETLTSVLIGLSRGGQPLGTIKLTNASLASYDLHGTTETWSLTYQRIEWTVGTSSASDDWEAPVN